jgi:hypothetical protein
MDVHVARIKEGKSLRTNYIKLVTEEISEAHSTLAINDRSRAI